MKIHCAHDELVSVGNLKPHPKNRNKHPESQIHRLAKILEYQGWRYPVKVSKLSGFVTSGHGRIEAARMNGWEKVPVNFQEYESEAQEYADVQADNAIASWSELDITGINTDLADMPGLDLDLLGIENFELTDVNKLESGCDADDVPAAPVEPRSKLGDLYLLGKHRLLCGDSTSITDVEKLMGGEKADLWITDPPYGVDYVAKNAAVNGGVVKNAVGNEIKNDTKSVKELCPFWRDVAVSALMATTDKASSYWFACQGSDKMMMMMMMMDEAGWNIRHELIWVKKSFVFGRSDYHYRHEPIIYGWKKTGTHEWCGDRKQDSVFEIDRPHKSDLHPTTKPTELIKKFIENSSKSGQLVLDTFGGSGTTLIASEETNRKCFIMELDPKYCDVIVTRYLKYTNQSQVNLNGEVITW